MDAEEFYPGERADLARLLQSYAAGMLQGAIAEMIERAIEANELREMRSAVVYVLTSSRVSAAGLTLTS